MIVPPRATMTYELAFPYPAGVRLSAPRLTGVNLRFALRHGDQETTSTATLERYFPPEPAEQDVQWHVGFGTRF